MISRPRQVHSISQHNPSPAYNFNDRTHFDGLVQETRNSSALAMKLGIFCTKQSGRSPKVVALFSAANFSSYIIKLLQLHDKIQIKWNYAWIHYNIAIRRHLMI